MSNSIVAGIVIKSEFCVSASKQFNNYIEYIDRDEAVRNKYYNEFSLYADYMGNPEKTTALFTASNDCLSDEQKLTLKTAFQSAQHNGSLMWQNVISFDNRWLEKYGVYNSLTGDLDTDKLMQSTRLAMSKMAEQENMKDTLIWSAAIHYNTDNIHIHIAAVESKPTREVIADGRYAGQQRGKLKQKTLDNFRTSVYQTMLDRSASYTDITNIIRNSIVGDKNHDYNSGKEMKQLYNEILSQLPPNTSKWKYNNPQIKHLQPKLNEMTNLYISKYHRKEYAKLLLSLDEEEKLQSEAFGKSERNGTYKQNKINDMYTRMGNAILSAMKQAYVRPKNDTFYISKSKHYNHRFSVNLSNLRKLLRKDWDSIVNQRAFEQLQAEIEKGSDNNYG